MEDKEITCIDYGKNPECQGTFVFTAREQEKFASMVDERTNQPFQPPKRCIPCRAIKKAKFADKDRRDRERDSR